MTRGEKMQAAWWLRHAGWSLADIAPKLDYRGTSSVWNLLHPEAVKASNAVRAGEKRTWEQEHDRGVCPCGTATSVGARRRGTLHCVACVREIWAVGRAMREERIAELWIAGEGRQAIADAIGSTPGSIGTALTHMRRHGWELPYRRAGWTKRVAA